VNETQKTGLFAALAVAMIVLAVVTRPVSVTRQDEKGGMAAGDLLFKEDAADFSKAASMKITKFDENKLSMDSFEVVKDKTTGLWKIPSEYDYPADAEEQLKNATAPLGDLRILDIIADAGRDDHALYGVVEPSEKLEAGVTGVGMLVSVADAAGKNMASLIVGKQADKTQEKLHYVRVPNQDPVYTVEIDTAAFNTDFKKWIKPDLLQVKSFDITGVGIRDYQIERTQNAGRLGALMSKSMEADLSYDTTSSKWKLDSLVTFKDGQPMPVELTDDQELKTEKLNSLRTAAQSLQIVGVRPKPKGLAADLKADKSLLESDESMISLFQQGFIPQPKGDTTEIYAVAGETLLTTRDGVRYVLRFGEERVTTPGLDGEGDEESKPEDAASKRERYLLVTATLDESKFPAPDLQEVPETIEDLKKLDAEKAAAQEAQKAAAEKAANAADENAAPAESEKSAQPEPEQPKSDESKPEGSKAEESKSNEPKSDTDEPAADAPKADDNKAEDNKADESKAEEAKADDGQAAESSSDESSCEPVDADAQEAAADAQDAAAKADDSKADDAKADDAKADDAKADDAKADDAKADNSQADEAAPAADKAAPEKPQETEEELKDRLSVVQSDITKSNQRLLDERNEKLTAARKKVQELNARFADWYYLIDDASFKQLMLKQDDLIGPKAPTPPSGGADAGAPAVPSFPGLPSFPQQ
jgi:hypothetical protein